MKEELIIRIIGKATLECPELDQRKLRDILQEVLYDYTVEMESREIALVSDINDRIKLYLISKKMDGVADSTLKNYSLHLNRFASFIRKDVNEIDTMDIRRYLAHLMTVNKIKNSTLDTEKSILKSFFSWLEIEDFIEKSPAKKLKPTKVEKREVKHLSIEELEQLREACETTRQRALLEFMFSTGGRLAEIAQVNISAIDWGNCSVQVIGKGNKERTIYFSPKAKMHIKKYMLERGISEEDALFIGAIKPHKRMGHNAIQQEIKRIASAAGLEDKVHPHILRHTFATLGLKSGMPLPVIQQILGHSSMDTTLIYAAMDKGTVEYEYGKHMSL